MVEGNRRESARAPLLYVGVWPSQRANRRYEELCQRLASDGYLRSYVIRVPNHGRIGKLLLRLCNSDAFAWMALRLIELSVGRSAGALLVTDLRQIRWCTSPCIVDIDDPHWDANERELLASSKVRHVVVTSEVAQRRLVAGGIRARVSVIPQGADERIAEEVLIEGEGSQSGLRTIFVYSAAYHAVAGDRRAAQPLYNLEPLLRIWAMVQVRLPTAELHILGATTQRVRSQAAKLSRVRLFGWIEPEAALRQTSRSTVGLYPRPANVGERSIKLAEYHACGLPIIGFKGPVTAEAEREGAGLFVANEQEFGEAMILVAEHMDLRAEMAAASRRLGHAHSWERLIKNYGEIIDDVITGCASRGADGSIH